MGAHIYPPRWHDSRVKDFMSVHGIGRDRNINDDFRDALATAVGKTTAQALTLSIDDLWDEFLIFAGITDTSEPFDPAADGMLATILTEDGLSYITKEDGKALIQE